MNPDAWKAVEPLVTEGGGVGGDYQAGESWSVRFLNDTIPGALIDVNVYAEAAHDSHGKPTGEYYIMSQVMYQNFTDINDPGGTETWADYEYEAETPLYGITATDLEQNEAMAKLIALQYSINEYFSWNGEPK